MEALFTAFANFMWGLPLVILLVGGGLFFVVYSGGLPYRHFRHALQILSGRFDREGDEGDIPHTQALSTALSGTLGLGNIAGVAVAITIGGPGAAFWMAIMGMFSMSTKFIEVTLGVKYRHHNDPSHKEQISGGPMYYLRDAINNRGIPYLGGILAGIFAIACIGGAIGGGNMFQANQAYAQLVNVTGGDTSWLADKGWLFGLGLAVLVGLVIIGGIKSIARAASAIVPLMAAIYLLHLMSLTGLCVTGA